MKAKNVVAQIVAAGCPRPKCDGDLLDTRNGSYSIGSDTHEVLCDRCDGRWDWNKIEPKTGRLFA